MNKDLIESLLHQATLKLKCKKFFLIKMCDL